MALDLAARGWHIALHYHQSHDDARQTADDIKSAGGSVSLLHADLSDVHAVRRLADQVPGNWLCLINNAAIFEPDRLGTHDDSSWMRHHAVNIRAPMILAQAFAKKCDRHHLEQDPVIINILDSRVWNITPYFTSYTASKAGLWAMTQSWALELAPDIRVNAMGPGPTIIAERQSEAHFAAQIAAQPLPVTPQPAEFCAALQFFLNARSVTGQMIALDGGSHLGWVNEGRLLQKGTT